MKHKKWIRNIHLLRNHELDAEEQSALDSHLNDCPDCRKVYEQLQLDWVSVMGELSAEPEIPDPQGLTSNIVSMIEPLKGQEMKTQRFPGPEDRQLNFHANIRLGLQVATLALLAIFFVEQYEITNSVRSLEKQLRNQSFHTSQARVTLLPDRIKKNLLANLRDQLNKRGLPSHRIERVLTTLELESQTTEFWKTYIGQQRRAQKSKTLLKRFKENWR
jgi:hypothetical protein